MHFDEWKCSNFGKNFTGVCPQGAPLTTCQHMHTPIRRQAIIWTSESLGYQRKYAALSLNELRLVAFPVLNAESIYNFFSNDRLRISLWKIDRRWVRYRSLHTHVTITGSHNALHNKFWRHHHNVNTASRLGKIVFWWSLNGSLYRVRKIIYIYLLSWGTSNVLIRVLFCC